MTRWIFLGDDSRWKFACWILKIAMSKLPGGTHKTILIRHDKIKFQLDEEENLLTISTYNLPPKIEVFIPAYSEDLQFDLEKFNRCAIFETHPLGRESIEDLAMLLESGKNNSMIVFILMDLLDEIDYDPIIDAKTRKEKLIKKNRDVLIARSIHDTYEILHWHRPMVSDLRRQIKHELLEIRGRINQCDNYFAEYVKFWQANGCLSEVMKNYITGFSNVKGHPHIWKCYNEAAQRVLFQKGKNANVGIYGAIELYKKILYNPTEFDKNLATFIWSVEADSNQLAEKIKEKFLQLMTSPKKYHNFLNSDEYNSEHIYKALVDRPGGRFYGIKKDFLNSYEKFICEEVLTIIKKELNDHIDKLRGMIE